MFENEKVIDKEEEFLVRYISVDSFFIFVGGIEMKVNKNLVWFVIFVRKLVDLFV